jgi:glycosyltransferase involved in cell wall biosynthesis
MKSQHIAYLIFRTRDNTGTRVVFNHALALEKLGHTVTIYTLFGTRASWYPKGVHTKSVFSYTHADVLVATFWVTAYVALLLPARAKYYIVMGWEEAFHSLPLIKFFARTSYKLPLDKIAVSHFLKERIEKYIKNKNSIAVIKTYIPEFIFSRNLRKNSKKPVILSVVSWYNRVKGIDLLVRTLKELKKQGIRAEFVLVSREKVAYSSAFDRFYSNPSKDELGSLYGTASVLLATSRIEGFYIPGIEAMANKCVFVSTNSGGISEYATNKQNALIVERLSDLWKKNVIRRVLANAKLSRTLTENGYKTAKEYKSYTLRKLGKDLEKLYFKKDAA